MNTKIQLKYTIFVFALLIASAKYAHSSLGLNSVDGQLHQSINVPLSLNTSTQPLSALHFNIEYNNSRLSLIGVESSLFVSKNQISLGAEVASTSNKSISTRSVVLGPNLNLDPIANNPVVNLVFRVKQNISSVNNYLIKDISAATASQRLVSMPDASGVIALSQLPTNLATDTDGDGLADVYEIAVGLDPFSSDSDNDGVSDANEDLDGDGLTNQQEITAKSDLLVADTDFDGLSDSEELSLGTSITEADTDGDGVLDGVEVANGQNPLDPTDNSSVPVADAGSAQTVMPGTVVLLQGAGFDTDGTIVGYQWTQTSGPPVILNLDSTSSANFIAPDVSVDTPMTFELMVTDNSGYTDTAVTDVLVTPTLITNFSSPGNGSYVWESLNFGTPFYTDRSYVYTDFPVAWTNLDVLRPPNDDKYLTGSSEIQFNVSKPVTIHILYDNRATALPSWMSGYTFSGLTAMWDWQGLNVYSQSFAAGPIVLGGNLAPPAAGSETNYAVVVEPEPDQAMPVTILTQPSDLTVQEGSSATLTVVANGTAPISYQWYRDSQAIPGANTASYTTPVLSAADNGATFYCLVTNAYSQLQSNIATIYVGQADLISNFSSPGSGSYVWEKLNLGTLFFTDRSYVYTQFPSSWTNLDVLRTPNDDKYRTGASEMQFDVSRTVTVHILYDERATALPDWMSGYTDSGITVYWDSSGHKVYSRTFTAGTIVLGGNLAPPASGSESNYGVVIEPVP